MKTLIDSSVWINFFLHKDTSLRFLIEDNLAVTTGVILLEIIPFLHEHHLRSAEKDLLNGIQRILLSFPEEHWEHLIQLQKKLLEKGVNGISIPDLIILFLCESQHIHLYTHDKTLKKAASILHVPLYEHA